MGQLRRGELTAAARELDAILDAEPEHFAARLLRAACALQQHRPGEARVGLTACLAQRPLFAWSYLLRGRAHRADGDLGAALKDFQRGLDLQPSEPARFALLSEAGQVRLALGEPDVALSSFRQATELLPDEPAGWRWQAEAQARLGRPADAVASLDRCVALGADPDVSQRRGWAYLMSNNPRAARGDFEVAIRGGWADLPTLIGLALAMRPGPG